MHQRIRTLITMAYPVSCDETPLRVGPRTPRPGKKKAEKYLLVACTELYTHYLVGDRSLDTFKASVVKDLTDSVIVHDRYQNYDSAELGTLIHQLCCAQNAEPGIMRTRVWSAARVLGGWVWWVGLAGGDARTGSA